jgi:hypothetical protein
MSTRRGAVKLLGVAAIVAGAGCGRSEPKGGLPPQKVADALYAAIAANRAVYTREVVGRLQDEESVIKASEHFRDDKALPLPAQMFRMGAEAARKQSPEFTYALLSPWPINKLNAPETDVEKAGLRAVADTGKSFSQEETLGGKKYFTAVYPDKASAACVNCHNAHRDSPRHDFKVGDIMGGVVIRIALN